MKKLLLFICCVLCFESFSQTNFYTLYGDNSNADYQYMHALPWDENRLVQIARVTDVFTGDFTYYMENGNNGLPFGVPGCGVLYEKPVFLNNGILASGASFSNGIELHYYDGINGVMFDINVGSGDSNPEVFVRNGEVFVVADDGAGVRNVFLFNQTTQTLDQLSFGTQNDIKTVLGKVSNEVFVTAENVDTMNGTTTYNLIKYDTQGTATLLKSFSTQTGSGERWEWNTPIFQWNELFITESYWAGFSSPQELSFFPVTSSSNYEAFDYFNATAGGSAFFQAFAYDSKLFVYLNGSDSLYRIEEHIQGTPPEVFTLAHSFTEGIINEHFISENNRLYFRLIESPSAINKIVRLENGLENVLISDDHLHLMLESNGVLYVQRYDESWIGTDDPCAVYLVNTAFDGVDKVEIELGLHGPFKDASLLFQGKYTFFFRGYDSTTDILQLESSPLAGINELSATISLHPNPAAEVVYLSLQEPVSGQIRIYDLSGKRYLTQELNNATGTQIDFSNLPAGVYLLELNGTDGNQYVKRVVKK